MKIEYSFEISPITGDEPFTYVGVVDVTGYEKANANEVAWLRAARYAYAEGKEPRSITLTRIRKIP